MDKQRLDKIVKEFIDWLNESVASNNTECDHTLKQFEVYCRMKKINIWDCLIFFFNQKIKCDCEIVLNYK